MNFSKNPILGRIESLFYGLTLPFQSLRLLFQKKKLLAWAALPFALTLALSIWGVSWLKGVLTGYGMHWLASHGFAPESMTVQAAMIFLQIVLFVLAGISFSFLATVVASPFNDLLSEATEPHCVPALSQLPKEWLTMRWKIRSVRIDIVKTVLVTGAQLLLIVVGIAGFWIPGLNLIPFLLAFWLLTFQFISYPQTRRGEGILTSLQFLFRHSFASLGFGAAFGILFAIPLLSAFALPLAVVSGTLLYARAKSPANDLR